MSASITYSVFPAIQARGGSLGNTFYLPPFFHWGVVATLVIDKVVLAVNAPMDLQVQDVEEKEMINV
jgi:hypothetical protein